LAECPAHFVVQRKLFFYAYKLLIKSSSQSAEENSGIRPLKLAVYSQGDQIGRIFAYWAIVFFGQCFITKDLQIWGLFFPA
jgi:hypothetical protein